MVQQCINATCNNKMVLNNPLPTRLVFDTANSLLQFVNDIRNWNFNYNNLSVYNYCLSASILLGTCIGLLY